MTTVEVQPGNNVQSMQRLKYPKSVFFIIGNEFCERYAFSGMRALLVLYLRNILLFSEDDSMLIYHTFYTLCFLFPLLGGILADSYVGKYQTILYLSIVHVAGNIVIALSATSWLYTQRGLCLLGLFLTALGVGGIKPCIGTFGGDQFVLPQQSKQLKRFFSGFYLSGIVGILVAALTGPVLRQDVKCLGQSSCYPLAFGLPALFMILALVLFICGRPWYTIRKPEGNILVNTLSCIFYAIRKKFSMRKELEKPSHWLEYAEGKYDSQLITDIQEALRVIVMCIPVPLYWALSDQQDSSWVFQASQMDGVVFNWFTIKPDQLGFLSPLLCFIFIPLYEVTVYPLIAKIGIKRPLQYITIGASLCASAFFISAFVEYKLEPSYAVLPQPDLGQIRIFNSLPCQLKLDPPINGQSSIPPLGALQSTDIKVFGSLLLKETLTLSSEKECNNVQISVNWTQNILIVEKKSISYVVSVVNDRAEMQKIPGYDDVTKSLKNSPKLRVIHNLNGVLSLKNQYGVEFLFQLTAADLVTSLEEMNSGMYKVVYEKETIFSDLLIESGGVYTLVLQRVDSKIVGSLHTITHPATLHIFWIFPQIFVIAAAEIFFSVTYSIFTFTEAPESMKYLLASVSSGFVSIGNILVVFIVQMKFFHRQTYQFLFYGGLMVLNVLILIILAIPYKYKKYEASNSESENPPPTEVSTLEMSGNTGNGGITSGNRESKHKKDELETGNGELSGERRRF